MNPLLSSERDPSARRAKAEAVREQMVARLEKNPSDFGALHTLGASLFVLGSHQSANTTLTCAIMLNPSEPWTWYWLARNCYAMGDPSAALLALSRALELNPSNPEFQVFHAMLGRKHRQRKAS